MVPVTEMGPVTDFYERVFGLEAAFRSDEWTELSLADDVMIALHRGLPTRQEVGLGFEVDDLEAACHLVTANGGTILDPPKRREGEGIRIAEVLDPAGNRVSVARGSRSCARPTPVMPFGARKGAGGRRPASALPEPRVQPRDEQK